MASEATHRSVEAAKGRLSHKARLEVMAGALGALEEVATALQEAPLLACASLFGCYRRPRVVWAFLGNLRR